MEIEKQAGGHPMLTQRLVSSWLDSRSRSGGPAVLDLAADLRVSLDQVFEDWWGREGVNGGFKEPERRVYHALLSLKVEEASILDLADRTSQSENDCRKCLHVLCGSGVVIATGLRTYRLGARVFADWVSKRGGSPEARIGPSSSAPVCALVRSPGQDRIGAIRCLPLPQQQGQTRGQNGRQSS